MVSKIQIFLGGQHPFALVPGSSPKSPPLFLPHQAVLTNLLVLADYDGTTQFESCWQAFLCFMACPFSFPVVGTLSYFLVLEVGTLSYLLVLEVFLGHLPPSPIIVLGAAHIALPFKVASCTSSPFPDGVAPDASQLSPSLLLVQTV